MSHEKKAKKIKVRKQLPTYLVVTKIEPSKKQCPYRRERTNWRSFITDED